MEWPGDEPFFLIKSSPASLAFLYRYLIAFGSSFLARWIELTDYYMPYDAWIPNNKECLSDGCLHQNLGG
jgi:hypothetical protein